MPNHPSTTEERARRWDAEYAERSARSLSWHQEAPTTSLELIQALGVDREAAVIDVGGGTSTLAKHLLEQGFVDISVLDISARALAEARRGVWDGAPVEWLEEDILVYRPSRRFDLWHDRAVFHFLVTADERRAYLGTLRAAVRPDGMVVRATFAPDGPTRCSGLPVARYSAEELVDQLGARFECLETRRDEHVTPRGVVQPFTWVAGQLRSARRS